MHTNISISIEVHSTDANTKKVHAEAYYGISYEGQPIIDLGIGEFEAEKEKPMVLSFLSPVMVNLNPPQRQVMEFQIKRNLIKFEIRGASKTWWQFGLLRVVKMKSSLGCELKFTPSNGSYVPSPCTSTRRPVRFAISKL